MKITLTIEVDDDVRVAIASENSDWTRLKPRPASKALVEQWLRNNIDHLLTATLETHDQGGVK